MAEERAFDTQTVNFLKEVYSKEEKFRNEFYDRIDAEEREREGTLSGPRGSCDVIPNRSAAVTPDNAVDASRSMPQTHNTFATAEDYDRYLQAELSKHLWKRVNPGYIEPKQAALNSTTKTAFIYDQSEIEPVSKEHFRKRDGFTQYVEASSRYKLLMKTKPSEK